MPNEKPPEVVLDADQWEDPTVEFFGTITKCEFRTSDDAKAKDGRTFTEIRGYPRAVRTWHVEVERMDAVYDLPDGESAPVTVYMTIDLERLVNQRLVPLTMSRGDNKPTYTVGKWKDNGFLPGRDPESLVGRKAQFKLERTHKFSGMMAKDILYPIKALPEGFVFDGEVSRFTVKERPGSLEQSAAEVEGTEAATEFDIGTLVGLPVEPGPEVYEFVKDYTDLPDDVKAGLVTGELQAALIEDGKMTAKKGKLVLA